MKNNFRFESLINRENSCENFEKFEKMMKKNILKIGQKSD